MPRGIFITLEGLDGSGKTTQIKRLACVDAEARPQSVVTRQPGGTATGDRIRALLLDSGSTPIAPMAEMALMFADRAQCIAEVIEPALAAGKIVLCDRFTDSTEAYQGGGREIGSRLVLELAPPHLRRSAARPHPAAASVARNLPRTRTAIATTARPKPAQTKAASSRNRMRSSAACGKNTARSPKRDPDRVILIEGNLSHRRSPRADRRSRQRTRRRRRKTGLGPAVAFKPPDTAKKCRLWHNMR